MLISLKRAGFCNAERAFLFSVDVWCIYWVKKEIRQDIEHYQREIIFPSTSFHCHLYLHSSLLLFIPIPIAITIPGLAVAVAILLAIAVAVAVLALGHVDAVDARRATC